MRNNQLRFINVCVALRLSRGKRFKIDSEISNIYFKKGLKIALREFESANMVLIKYQRLTDNSKMFLVENIKTPKV